MIISHKHKFVFIAVPKTATATIREALKTHSDIIGESIDPPYDWHPRAVDLKKHFHKKKWDWNKYFKFAFVRNPWDRLNSEYLYRKKRISVFKDKQDKPKYIIESEKMFRNVDNFAKWVKSEYINTQNPCFPNQCKYLMETNNELLVDFVGKFENLQQDFNIVCDKIGIERQTLQHKNKTKHKFYTEYYDEEARQIVAEVYADEIKCFDYEFGE